jgi:hypothetical protein
VRLQPVESRGRVRQFARAIFEQALAAADAAEIETQHRKAAAGEDLLERMHDRIVHRAAERGMGMKDNGDGRSGGLVVVVARFDPAGRAVENHLWHEEVLIPVAWTCGKITGMDAPKS